MGVWRGGGGGGIAQLVQRPTEKTQAQYSPQCSNGFFPRVNLQCRPSCGVRTAPRVQSQASAAVCMLKSQTRAAVPLSGYTGTYRTHTDRTGSRCSCGCCALPRCGDRIFCRGQWSAKKKKVLKKQNKKKNPSNSLIKDFQLIKYKCTFSICLFVFFCFLFLFLFCLFVCLLACFCFLFVSVLFFVCLFVLGFFLIIFLAYVILYTHFYIKPNTLFIMD